ncbi:carbon starvation protein A [Mycoplasma sp. P36-A1]|uniref:carbon starvation CstA family protein n=1 Tax=Mycoplasma sp. P36-A1 TaxID=3252900 RepID=UPI003C2C3DC4
MITFLFSIVALIVGYFTYGKFVEKVFGADPNRETPVKSMADGIDFVELPKAKAFLIQFLNIAGTGPIFGAIAGAMWGPAAFMWIVFGCIFAGATHDYLVGMMSLRDKGKSVSEVIGDNLGNGVKQFMRGFSIILLILVGTVFIASPADILKDLTGIDRGILIAIIIVYYVAATVLPVDKIIGKIYPLFGAALLIMAAGIMYGLLFEGYHIPELTFANVHPAGKSIFPYLFVSIACGAISGFHATQSPMVARTLGNEREGRSVFYGAMITEGIVALIWAAAAMSFFGGLNGLAEVVSAPASVVNQISSTMMGKVGGVLAVLGVVAAPISSGDTAFRSARLNLADIFNIKQGPIKNRFMLAIPLFACGIALTFIDFTIIWRYFAWANQTLATIALWAGAAYLLQRNKNYFIALIPALFMTVVVVTYILVAPEGLGGFLPFADVATKEMFGIIIGIIVSLSLGGLFFAKSKKYKGIITEEPITD